MSTLSISSCMGMDSGNYSCSLPNSTLSDVVEVSVQQGDHFQQLRPPDTSGTVTVGPQCTVFGTVIAMLCTQYKYSVTVILILCTVQMFSHRKIHAVYSTDVQSQ